MTRCPTCIRQPTLPKPGIPAKTHRFRPGGGQFTARAKSPNAINVEPTKIARWTWFRPEEFPKNSFGKIDEVISEYLLPKG